MCTTSLQSVDWTSDSETPRRKVKRSADLKQQEHSDYRNCKATQKERKQEQLKNRKERQRELRPDMARTVGTPGRMRLRIETIRLDFQPAENLIEETVQKYVACLKCGEELAPLSVRFDGHTYFLADGFHRVAAAKRCGVTTLEADVTPGTLEEMEAEFSDHLKRLRARLAKWGMSKGRLWQNR